MSEAWIAPMTLTIFWAIVGIIGPFFAKGSNAGFVSSIKWAEFFLLFI